MRSKIDAQRFGQVALVALGLLTASTVLAEDAAEEATVAKTSPEMTAALDRDADIILNSGIGKKMSTTALGATSGADFDKIVAAIKAETPLPNIATGTTGESYDIIIQPGHYGRKTGKTGAEGKLVSERALTAYVIGIVAEQLKASNLKVLTVPADGVPSGLKAKVFLSVHADASTKSCSSGPSMAYADDSSLLAMHAIGFGLARAFGYNYKNFMKDNFTVDEAHYYMFSKVNTSVMKGLLELGELTCSDTEKRLVEASKVIGKNLAVSLAYISAMPDK